MINKYLHIVDCSKLSQSLMLAAEAIYHYLSLFYYIVSSQVVDTGNSGWFRTVELSWDAMRGLAQEPDRRYSWNIPSLLYIRVTFGSQSLNCPRA